MEVFEFSALVSS